MIIKTKNPLALDSDDYKHPRGARQDNTRCPSFLKKCLQLYKQPSLLDLGCAGGGLVREWLDVGLNAVGIEGSDYQKTNRLGEWPMIPDQLLLADITKPFALPEQFTVISAWEVLEHIRECDLKAFFRNITQHLEDRGLFVCSVATFKDLDERSGAIYHVTIQSREWWHNQLGLGGLRCVTSPFDEKEYARGSQNPFALGDWQGGNYGFHMVAKKA